MYDNTYVSNLKLSTSPFRKGRMRGILNRLLYNQNLKRHSRKLRLNMTDAEKQLWSKIRMKQAEGFQFYRQKIIGDYIVDFFCHRANLVIELDGGQHYAEEGAKSDRLRDEYMRTCGLKVLRFSDADVLKNVEGVVQVILESLRSN